MSVILIVHAAATLIMTGVIWFVQTVHYPLMAEVPQSRFAGFEAEHSRRTTRVVAGPMIVEALTALILVGSPHVDSLRPLAWVGFGLLAATWASTVFLQVPCHRALGERFDSSIHRRLVRTNWIRTVGWSARGGLVIWMLWRTGLPRAGM